VIAWHRVQTWGEAAKIVGLQLPEGSRLYVEDRLVIREWSDKSNKRQSPTDILASDKKIVSLQSIAAPSVKSWNPWLSPGPAEILPGTSLRVVLWLQDLRAWIFRGVELKDHPLRVRNARIRRRV
jgi:hypothetical protein